MLPYKAYRTRPARAFSASTLCKRVDELNAIKVLGGGGVGEETLLQKGPSPTKSSNVNLPTYGNRYCFVRDGKAAAKLR